LGTEENWRPRVTRIEVRYQGGDRLLATVRGHELAFDQPLEDGGQDTAPTPVEAFVGSLAACVAFYAERFLRRHELPLDGLAVDADFGLAEERPARVGRVSLRLRLPVGFPSSYRDRLAKVVEHCTVHNSIRAAPEIEIELEGEATAA
jgi:uncharacterized OsmC-like protein